LIFASDDELEVEGDAIGQEKILLMSDEELNLDAVEELPVRAKMVEVKTDLDIEPSFSESGPVPEAEVYLDPQAVTLPEDESGHVILEDTQPSLQSSDLNLKPSFGAFTQEATVPEEVFDQAAT